MSSKFFSLFCLLLVALLVLPSSLHAQEDDGATAQSDEDISRRRINTEQNSAYVEADYIFPDHPNFELHAGERTQMLITLTNSGQHPYTVLYARGTLYFANDAQYSIENYTVGVYELTVNPSEQRSIQYYFTPHPMLDLSEYGLYTKIYYQDADGLNYTATVVNRTISIVEPDNSYDADYLVRVGSTAAIIIIIAVIGWRAVSPAEAPKRRIELGTTSSGSPDDEWLAQTAAAAPVKKKRAEEASR